MTDERTSDEIYVATLSQQLGAITRRAFVPRAFVDLYIASPLIEALLPQSPKDSMNEAVENARKLYPEVFSPKPNPNNSTGR